MTPCLWPGCLFDVNPSWLEPFLTLNHFEWLSWGVLTSILVSSVLNTISVWHTFNSLLQHFLLRWEICWSKLCCMINKLNDYYFSFCIDVHPPRGIIQDWRSWEIQQYYSEAWRSWLAYCGLGGWREFCCCIGSLLKYTLKIAQCLLMLLSFAQLQHCGILLNMNCYYTRQQWQ